MKTYFKPGSWNAVCDVCGFRFKADQLMRRWDGLMTCSKDWETDHPQKYIRVDAERSQSVPFTRQEPIDVFNYICYIYASMGYSDIAEADCTKVENTIFTYAHARELKGI